MRTHSQIRALWVGVVALVIATLPVVGGPPASADPPDPSAVARERLRSDATAPVTLRRSPGGEVTFVGTPAGAEIVHPGVDRSRSVEAAAAAHLDRYGAALGADRAGTSLVARSAWHTPAGTDVVTFTQEVGGVPVVGGDVVVSLRPDRQLGSLLADLSSRTRVPQAKTDETAARATARAAVVRSAGGAGETTVVDRGRWLLDAAVLGARPELGAHTGWRFEVRRGVDVRRDVIVDDQAGRVLLDLDLIQEVDRVVCDRGNIATVSPVPCTSGFARTEASGPSAVTDVNLAFDLSGAVSDFYDDAVSLDLTDTIGVDLGGTKKLASSVQVCLVSADCPYANAFWNGVEMFYGQGYAGADDVVGHEITHGVIDRYSELFYWGQSGAINESLADIMGEIVDHRYPTAGDSATDWALGEDIPGFPSGLRNLQDPTVFGDPDATSSANYVLDASYFDSGGVHTNSGVSNKTAYLIAKGGTFNGQSITGIDAGNDELLKTARLYFQVITTLSSGSDFADLAVVLDQSCQDLLGAGSPGFTAADCTDVHKAGLATALALTPTNASQPADAPATCPPGSSPRVLLDSEAGTPSTTFTPGSVWSYGVLPDWGSNAHSGVESWAGANASTFGTSSLVAAAPVALPAGQPTFLHFHHWRLLETQGGMYYDAGTVEVDVTGDALPPADTAALPWINGPTQIIAGGNPAAGRLGFGGDSLGYVASRVDLSSYGGSSIVPQFTMNTDPVFGFIGWFIDDITVYTCDSPVVAGVTQVSGKTVQGSTLQAITQGWSPAGTTFAHVWLADGNPIPGATGSSYLLGSSDVGSRIAVRVTGSAPGFVATTVTTPDTAAVRGVITARTPKIVGKAAVKKKLKAKVVGWKPAGLSLRYRWLANGKTIKKAKARTYRVRGADRGKKLQVRVTATKAGYLSTTKTSSKTKKVR